MRQMLLPLAERAHRLTMMLCVVCLAVVLFSMLANVMLRHGISVGFLKLQDLTLYAFGVFAILSIPVALADGRHVRLDLPITRMAGAGRRRIVVISLLIYLLPIALLLFIWSAPQFLASLKVLEGSGQIGGLGGLFVVKGFLPMGALLIALQGIAACLKTASPVNMGRDGD